MSDSLVQDSIKIAEKNLTILSEKGDSPNIWFWVAIIEFLFIIFLIIRSRIGEKNSAKQKLKKESINEVVDFNNIINSSFHSTELFDELKVKCHPDRFATNNEKYLIADKLFQEISKNKTNVKRLLEIKEEAEQKLNINFKS